MRLQITSYTYSLDLPVDQLPEADKGFINDKYWFNDAIPIGFGILGTLTKKRQHPFSNLRELMPQS